MTSKILTTPHEKLIAKKAVSTREYNCNFSSLFSSPHADISVGYVLSEGFSKQQLYKDRLIAEPTLDLALLKIKSVVDWIEIAFATKGEHQATKLQAKFAQILGSGIYVNGPIGEKLYQGKSFRVRIQDPKPAEYLAFLRGLSKLCTVTTDTFGDAIATISGLETSVDFYSKSGKAEERWQANELLRHHLFVDPRITGLRQSSPRSCSVFEGKPRNLFALKTSRSDLSMGKVVENKEKMDADVRSRVLKKKTHQKMHSDGTYYVGRKDGPIQIKIMYKSTDQKNRAKGTRTDLPVGKIRTRIEVTLKKSALDEFELDSAWSVFGFNFASLRKKAFDFYLPTFPNSCRNINPTSKGVNCEFSLFERSGVYGLFYYQRAENQLIEERHSVGSIEEPADVLGTKGYLRAYATLNTKVDSSLRKLDNHWDSTRVKEKADRILDLDYPSE